MRSQRITCSHDDCTEVGAVASPTQRERKHLERRGRPWKGPEWTCLRHGHPETVLSLDTPSLSRELVCVEKPYGKFWTGPGIASGQGFISGPGFMAWADDFPAGTRIRIGIEVLETTPEPC